MRKIARHRRLAPKTVKKYLLAPAQTPVSRSRASKLHPFKLTLTELLDLFCYYRPEAIAAALQKAHAARAFGADYVANLLRQQQSPRNPQPPLQLKDPELNQLTTDPLSLLDYDAFIPRSEFVTLLKVLQNQC